MSWGHDEYLARVLEKNSNKHRLPEEAIYIIRFHSFYPWHTPKKGCKRSYNQYANLTDWKMLPLVKMFQLSDLYSKSKHLLDNEQLTVKYRNLIEKYFFDTKLTW